MRLPRLLTLAITIVLVGCAPLAPVELDLERSESSSDGVNLRDVYPFDLADTMFVDGTGRAVRRSFQESISDEVILTEQIDESGDVLGRVVLRRTPDGDVVILATERPARDLRTRFDPPMAFVASSLAQGDLFEQTFSVETSSLRDTTRVRDRGEARHSLVRLEDARAPDGVMVAVFRSTLELRLGPAQVSTVSEYALAPGVGLVERSSDRSVRVFGIPVERESESLRRVDSSGAPDSADTP